jgi:hypothetical protein
MTALEWQDLLEGLFYVFAQPIFYGLAVFLVLSFLAAILQFLMDSFSSPGRRED